MAVIADPAGGVFGVWEAGEHKGAGVANEPGVFVWNELLSRDPAASRDFLGKLFGYDWEPMAGVEMMDYQTAKLGDRAVTDVMNVPPQLPEDVPSHWMTYFAVADTDEAVAKATASGGTVMQPPFDSPHGRIALIADPQGAIFFVVSQPS